LPANHAQEPANLKEMETSPATAIVGTSEDAAKIALQDSLATHCHHADATLVKLQFAIPTELKEISETAVVNANATSLDNVVISAHLDLII
jgi:UDP-3-O-[3-hydroxymyristoyl] glucosamine N-acyltransferase